MKKATIDLDDAVSLLRAKRVELLNQLEAVDKALAALSGVDAATTPIREETPHRTSEEGAPPVVATRVKARKVLSDDHKHRLSEARRKARHSKDAVAGLARELLDPSARTGAAFESRPPRLVKRTAK